MNIRVLLSTLLTNMPIILSTMLLTFFITSIVNHDHNRYQIAGIGTSGAMVIDQVSGEAWITDHYEKTAYLTGTEKITYLKPVGYCDLQKEEYTYKPEEKRNNKNATWWIWLKRKISFKHT